MARIGAADSLYLGLATHVVASDALQALDETLLAADLGGDAHAAIDRLLAESAAYPGPAPLAAHQAAIDRCFSAGSVEEIVAKLEAEGSDWAEETLAALRQKSPTSLKVSFKQLTEYGERDFEEAMALEYRLAMHCNLGDDFFEGIRAQIVDKDRNPAKPILAPGAAGRRDGGYGRCLFRGAAQGRHDVVNRRERRC